MSLLLFSRPSREMQRSTGSHHARYGRRKPGNGLVVSLPGKPSAELLDRARREVPIYRDWMSHDGPSGGDPETRNEINRASARLIEISLHWRPACEGETKTPLAADRVEYDRQRRDRACEMDLPHDA
jgi:hypothetical protein